MSALPAVAAWRAAAACHDELFAALDPGARIGLVAREAPVAMLLWEVGSAGIEVRECRSRDFRPAAPTYCSPPTPKRWQRFVPPRASSCLRYCAPASAAVPSICYILRRRCDLTSGF